ncbi:23S rRNA (guanosine(2251)-2'-O)-methyltransferase RlmB [Planktosalinus lacus]|uniref:23S rRNA (Guanosine(2251)-2'-O)-methyltransferase RlmB n=1 Tax=Planktosalinus lacus TaxID=1526573 RepID=A0A8J2Y5U6_9FLAO|nr:23S rRNA (guanosine(2251)-2'-O)-methyltransferase RlmB [Planktosalinus lacus]GGD88009.1 23S rRNA (guanosine(2251)-2'-O)-methyltransferase RlmB [Planktosalinus lacus]
MQKDTQIIGIRAIIEAIKAGTTIDKVFIQKNTQGELMSSLLKLLKQHSINFSYVPVEKLNKLSQGNHQGAVATISPISFVALEQLVEEVLWKKENPLFLILDQLSDTGNFGAIIRTASCTGVDGIIIQKHGAAPVNATTVKTSAGAVFKIPICKVDHIKDAVFYFQSSGIQIIAATEKAKQTIYEHDLKPGVALIMGSEEKGINPSVLKLVDTAVKLPILGEIESLNVSVACGAMLYEIVRQRL